MGQGAHYSFFDDTMSEQRPEGDTEVSQADIWEKNVPEERKAHEKHLEGRRTPTRHV